MARASHFYADLILDASTPPRRSQVRRRIWSILLAAVAIPASAANFSGKWAIQSPAGRGGGRGAPTILTLNQVGNEVTGSISVRIDAGTSSPVNTEVLGGKVEGEVLSFYVWTGTDQPAKTAYNGTMSPSGDEITFTVTGGRGQGAGPQQVTAKRTK
jgi:hypothetical protein